jgi:hypothetical protein
LSSFSLVNTWYLLFIFLSNTEPIVLNLLTK